MSGRRSRSKGARTESRRCTSAPTPRAGAPQRHGARCSMSRGPYSFKQRDMTRAVKAVVAAGLAVARVEVDKDGKIVIVPGTPEATTESSAWDKAIADLELR